MAGEGEQLRLGGGSKRIEFKEPFYVGIGVCAHDPKVVEKAVFSNVELATGPPAKNKKPVLYSTLEVVPVSTTDCRTVWVGPGRIESPNWTKDGAQLAISDQSRERGRSIVYIVPAGGGAPKQVTQKSPSYFHGWSPDGKTIVFTGERNGKLDIYTIPATGGEETRLTTAKGVNDSAGYSPDGKIVYFNSDRSGSMQVWRMQADGTGQEQVTSGDAGSWFPHLSPNGRQLVFLSLAKEVTGRPVGNRGQYTQTPISGNRRRPSKSPGRKSHSGFASLTVQHVPKTQNRSRPSTRVIGNGAPPHHSEPAELRRLIRPAS